MEYIRSNVTTTVGCSVTLNCGSTVPAIFIWGFTKPGTENNIAVAYNYGQGPKVQSQFSSLGRIEVPTNTSALVIEELKKDAAGMYTCQALYDTEEGARITFYFTRLDVESKRWVCSINVNLRTHHDWHDIPLSALKVGSPKLPNTLFSVLPLVVFPPHWGIIEGLIFFLLLFFFSFWKFSLAKA